MEFVYPILIFVVMGIVFGVLLVVISKVFAVKTDERAVQITEALPGANCGACGYAGCADYADAIVNKGAPMNACLPGGANAAAAIGDIMGVSVTASERMVPVLHCNGTCEATNRKFTFDGVQSCTAAKRFYGGTGVCAYGCLGLGDCVSVCENDVISIKDGIATFCTEKCVACNKCAKVCPNGLIELRSEKKRWTFAAPPAIWARWQCSPVRTPVSAVRSARRSASLRRSSSRTPIRSSIMISVSPAACVQRNAPEGVLKTCGSLR